MTHGQMAPLQEWSLAERLAIRGVFTDIDDTLTADGAITPDALQALQRLHAAGLPVIAITGRPMGWSEPFARAWPVAAIVAENGAAAWVQNPQATPIDSKIAFQSNVDKENLLSKIYQSDASTRAANYARLQQVEQLVLRSVPGTLLARDSAGRETDIAIDHSEYSHLPPDKIAQVLALLNAQGLQASVSSIHINAWIGTHNKLQGARWIVRALWQRDLDAELDHWVYVGDSSNDELMFAAFAQSVGVANIARFVPTLSNLPRYVTSMERGAGFAQVVDALCAARTEAS